MSYNPIRPLVIALCVVLILSLILSCIRRRRAMALHQQHLQQQQQHPTTELGDVAYIYQYPPPPGTPSNTYQPPPTPMTGQTMYGRPPGAPPMMSQSPGGYYPPMAGTVIDMDGQGQQAPFAYPPMPVAPAPTATGASSSNSAARPMAGSTYVAAQDGSANLTNADIQEGIPAVPPPPYTPTIPK
jgi:hypothetical protein